MGLVILGIGLAVLVFVMALVSKPQGETKRQIVIALFAAGFLMFGFLGVCTATSLPVSGYASDIGLGPLVWTVVIGSIAIAIAFAIGIWRNRR